MLFGNLSETISAYSALAAAIVAVVTLCLSLRNLKQRMRAECDQRVHELRMAFEDGLRYERRRDVP